MVSSEKISELNKRLGDLFKYLSIEKKEKKVLELETITQSNNFWDNPEEAQKTLKQLSKVKIWVIAQSGEWLWPLRQGASGHLHVAYHEPCHRIPYRLPNDR